MVQRKSGHVTLQNIADACGFSVSTVSIVLSKAPLSRFIAAATRDKVQAMARQLGYYPDAYARSLRKQRSQTIGVLVYDLSDPFCIPILRGIQAKLQPAHLMPLLMDVQARRDLFDTYLKTILERRAEGIIVVANWIFAEKNLLADIAKNQVPIVMVGRDLSSRQLDSILVDNEMGGAMALNYLYRLGHRQIGVIRGPVELFDSEPRWRGVQRVCRENGLELAAELVQQLPSSNNPISSFEGGRQACRQMLISALPFSAVVAFDDMTALGVIRALQEAGRSVPDDCSVVGFDDVLPAAMNTPGLTSIHQPLHEMGQLAAEWIVNDLETKNISREPQIFIATPELVERMSTKAISACAIASNRE
jgi:DNA-binding LacI/PurR family transcriptional regulator